MAKRWKFTGAWGAGLLMLAVCCSYVPPAQAAEAKGTLTVVVTIEPSVSLIVRSDGSVELIQANARVSDQVSSLTRMPVASGAESNLLGVKRADVNKVSPTKQPKSGSFKLLRK